MFLNASTTESVPGLSLLKVERARARPYTCEEACEEAVGCIFLWLGEMLGCCWTLAFVVLEVGEGYCLRRSSCFQRQGDLFGRIFTRDCRSD